MDPLQMPADPLDGPILLAGGTTQRPERHDHQKCKGGSEPGIHLGKMDNAPDIALLLLIA